MVKYYRLIKGFADTQLELLKVGLSGGTFGAHYHKRFCAGKVETGSLIIRSGRQSRIYTEGDHFYIPALQNHSCRVPKNQPVKYTVISFVSGDELKKIKADSCLFDRIKRERLMSLFEFACRLDLTEKKSSNIKIRELIGYINQNYGRPLTARGLALRVNLSISRLQHIFKAETGLTLKQVITQERIRKARQMLSGYKLNGIALDCGFYDQSHFNRYFKKYTGIAPLQYARSIQNIGTG